MQDYKAKLGAAVEGTWRGKAYAHILVKNEYKLNLLGPYRDSFFANKYVKEINFHDGFTHLNSSQAMCINYFYPMIKERELDCFANFLGFENGEIIYESACFEKPSDIERLQPGIKGGNRKTNFDFYFEFAKGRETIKIYVEAKYSETDFGSAKQDSSHSQKYDYTYKPMIESSGIKPISKQSFLANYQIMRNLVHIDEQRYVVLLYPKKNKNIAEKVKNVKDFLKPEYVNHLHLVTLEEAVKLPEKSVLYDYYCSDFYEKYLDF